MSHLTSSVWPVSNTKDSQATAMSENTTSDQETTLRSDQLSVKNVQLVQEVQKLKKLNGQAMKRIMELSRNYAESVSENVRLKEKMRRMSRLLDKFVPIMVTGTTYLDGMAKELEDIDLPMKEPVNANLAMTDSLEDIDGVTGVPVSPLRTGIARPIVQGHTICKPSISLQRVVPRETITSFVPMPVRSLNLPELARGGNQNRSLNDVSEEEDTDSREENRNSDENDEDTSSEERRNSGESSEQDYEIRNRDLSVVEEVSILETSPTLSVIHEQPSLLSPVVEERTPTAGAGSSGRSARKSSSTSEEELLESSDDEAVELSLIESRVKLMNVDRRKELKEGTSKDYDARGNFSPHSRKKRKKEKSPARGVNETSAVRKSLSGLLNSIKKVRTSKSKRSAESTPPSKVNGVSEDLANPRVSLVRINSSRRKGPSDPSGTDNTVSAEAATPPVMVSKRKRGAFVTTRNKRSRNVPVEDEVVEEAAHTVEEPPRRTGKRRTSWTELMRKRSRSLEEAQEPDIVILGDSPRSIVASPSLTEESGRSPNGLPTILISRISDSFIALNTSKELRNNDLQLNGSTAGSDRSSSHLKVPSLSRKRSRSSDKAQEGASKTGGNQPSLLVASPSVTEEKGRASNELLAVVLNRASQDFIARNTSKDLQNISLDDSTSSSDLPLSRLKMPRTSGKSPSNTSAAKPAKAKPRSKSKRPSKVANSVSGGQSQNNRNSNRSTNSDASSNSVNQSVLNTSNASSIDERDISAGFSSRVSATGRPRRATAPKSLKEKPLNMKLRR